MKRTLAIVIALSAAAIYATPSTAGLLVKTYTSDGNDNDCMKVGSNNGDGTVYNSPGNGFSDCGIWAGGELVSPVIAKYEFNRDDDGGLDLDTEIGSAYPDFDTLLIEFTPSPDLRSGTWSYNQGADDPGIRFWVAKGGNQGFNLFWMIDEADNAKCDESDELVSFACLDAAQTVTSGAWKTPTEQGLSHITFFNSAYIPVPEPGSLALLGLGLIGLRFARQRSKAA